MFHIDQKKMRKMKVEKKNREEKKKKQIKIFFLVHYVNSTYIIHFLLIFQH